MCVCVCVCVCVVGGSGHSAEPSGVRCTRLFTLEFIDFPLFLSFFSVFLSVFLKSIKKFSSTNTLIFFNPHLHPPSCLYFQHGYFKCLVLHVFIFSTCQMVTISRVCDWSKATPPSSKVSSALHGSFPMRVTHVCTHTHTRTHTKSECCGIGSPASVMGR